MDWRDVSNSDSDDDDYRDTGFDAAHAAYLARQIAEARAASASSSSSASSQSSGMSPFDESNIDHEWEELVKSMKAIVPSQTVAATQQTTQAEAARGCDH